MGLRLYTKMVYDFPSKMAVTGYPVGSCYNIGILKYRYHVSIGNCIERKV
jgi:hypothetical protein